MLQSSIPNRLVNSLRARMNTLRHNMRLAARWRGDRPSVYFHDVTGHGIWRTYSTHPPLRYAPYVIAELCHRLNRLPVRPWKTHVVEAEHVLYTAPGDMADWRRVVDNRAELSRLLGHERCKTLLTFSAGLVEHCKHYVHPHLWPKLDYVYPAYPSQPECERLEDAPFTILIIASRFSDKGIPEALRAHEILRRRHGAAVQTILVSQAIPRGYRLPEGVTHFNTPKMSEGLKARLYRSADVLLAPCYSETVACFTEAYAFGVPVITTRIHHGDEFVREGITGYLVDAPLFPYSDGFGVRWAGWEEFLSDLEIRRERGELDNVVDQVVDRLEGMVTGRADMAAMRGAARQFHAAQFSPEVRNRKLLRIYAEALE